MPTSPNWLLFFGCVRGTDGVLLAGRTDCFDFLSAAAIARNVPVTWLFRWDTFGMAHYQAVFESLLAAGHEIGIWLEYTENHCAAAGVAYNTSGSEEFGAQRCTPLGYTLEENKALIDAVQARCLEQTGRYASTVGMWMETTEVVNYLRSRYRATCSPYCRNQKSVDAYDLAHHPNNQFREASSNFLAVPCRGSSGRSGIVVIEPHASDILNYYGSSGNLELYAAEPVAIGRMYATYGTTIANYWRPITLQNLTQTVGRASGNISCSFCENGWDVNATPSAGAATNGTYMTDLFDGMNAIVAENIAILSTARDAAAAFLSSPASQRDQIVIQQATSDPLGVSSYQAVETFSPWYRSRVSFKEGAAGSAPVLGVTALVPYSPNLTDPNNGVNLMQDLGTIEVPGVVWSSDYRNDDTNGATPFVQHDRRVDGTCPLNLRTVYFKSGGAFLNYFSLDGNGTTATSLTRTHLPTTDDPRLAFDTALSGTQELIFRRRALLWDWRVVAEGEGALVLWNLDLLTANTGTPACTLYWKVGAAPEESYSPPGGVGGGQTQVDNWDYIKVVYTSGRLDGAALLIVPVADTQVNGTRRFSYPGNGVTIQCGVSAAAAGTAGMQVAFIPCLASEIDAVLAEYQANPRKFTDPDPAPSIPRPSSVIGPGSISVGVNSGTIGPGRGMRVG